MINIYKATQDFGVTDQESPIYGSHVAGSEVDTTPEAAAPYVASGQLELVSEGKKDESLKAFKVVAEEGITVEGVEYVKDAEVEFDPKNKEVKKLVKSGDLEEVAE